MFGSLTLIFNIILAYFRKEIKCNKPSSVDFTVDNDLLKAKCVKLEEENSELSNLLAAQSIELSRIKFVRDKNYFGYKKAELLK